MLVLQAQLGPAVAAEASFALHLYVVGRLITLQPFLQAVC
jgi:hypothetical protein